jgi:VCBS repeat-containing protein
MKISEKESKLSNYLALAGAVIASNSINSQIVYSDIPDTTIDLTSAPFLIDFDNNSVPEITFSVQPVDGSNTYMGIPITYEGALAVGVLGSNVALAGALGSGSGSSSYSFQLAALNEGDPISGDQAFGSSSSNVLGANVVIDAGLFGTFPYQFGPFLGATDKFLGASFVVNGDIHYGWVRLSIDSSVTSITIKDFAYNACANGPINAGDTSITLLPMTASSNLTCNNIELTVQGGNGSISYDWSNDGTGDFDDNEDAIVATSGQVEVIYRDEQCQVDTLSFTIDASNAPVIALNNSSVLDIACNGDGGNINIDATLNGGAINPTFVWSSGQSTEDISNLSGGDYAINLTDENGCSAEASFTVTEPDAIDASYSTTNEITGNDGTIDVTVDGGVGPYSYSWTPNLGSTQDLSNLSAGNYSVTITDANGCSEVLNITVNSSVGIEELSSEAVQISPNPNSGNFSINSNGLEFKSVEVFAMNGTLVHTFKTNGASTELNLNVEKGVYLLKMNLENGVITKRILVN